MGLFVTGSNTLVTNLFIQLDSLAGTRLELFGAMYEKFLFRNLRFHVVSAAPATASGSYILAYDRDVSDPTPPATIAGSKQLLSYEGSCEANIWEPLTINCPLDNPDAGYYTNSSNGDERLFSQGQLYLWQLVGASAANLSFTIWVEYDCEFFVPQLETPIESKNSTSNISLTPTDYGPSGPQVDNLLSLLNNANWTSNAITTTNGPLAGKTAIKLAAGVYRLSQVFGNTVGTAYGAAANIGAPTARLIAVENKESALATVSSAPLTAISSVNAAVTATLQGMSEYFLSVPPSGAWLYTALNNVVSIATLIANNAYVFEIAKAKSMPPLP